MSLLACQKTDSEDTKDLFYIKNDGAIMPAYVFGNIKSDVFIIILHGGPGGTGMDYRVGTYKDDLEHDYAMVYFDQRGQGMALGHLDSDEMTAEQMSEDVYVLAKALKERYGQQISLFLMGHSWGGTLGSTVLINEVYQQEFKGWIDVDGVHNFPLMFKAGIRALRANALEQLSAGNSMQYWDKVIDSLNTIDTNTIDFTYINSEAFAAEAILVQDNVLDLDAVASLDGLYNVLFVNNSVTTFVTGYFTNIAIFDNGLPNYNIAAQLHKIKIPSLLLWGAHDMVVSPEMGAEALENIGSLDKFLVIFERSGHSPMINEPLLFSSEVIDFVEAYK